MNLFSKYLQSEVELGVNEREDSALVVSHKSLQDFLMNGLDPAMGTRVDYQVVSADVNHSVVICSIYDDNGRRAKELGESTPETLTTEIGAQYPTLMAAQRAFDRAAIQYLGLDGRVYSNLELNSEPSNDPEPPHNAAPAAPAASNNAAPSGTHASNAASGAAAQQQTTAAPAAGRGRAVRTGNNGSDRAAKTKPASPANNPPAPAPAEKKPWDGVIVCLGRKYEGQNKTVEEVAAENPGYVAWACKYNPRTPEQTACVEAFKAYAKAHPELG